MLSEGRYKDGKRWQNIRKLRRKEWMSERDVEETNRNLCLEDKGEKNRDYEFDKVGEHEDSTKKMRRNRKCVGRRRRW